MSDRWLDTEGAAEYTGFAVSTLEKYRTYGGGPEFAKVNRSIRYRISALDAWMSAVVASSTSQLQAA
jgi:hypothetical protein